MSVSLAVRVRQTAPPVVQDEGVDLPSRARLNFIGCTVADDAANGRTNVTPPGGGGAASEGRETITFADANIALTSTQEEAAILRLAGANTVTRDLTFAVPTEGTSRVYEIEMAVTGAGVRLTTGTGSTWTIPAASGGALHTAVVTPSGITVSGPSGSGAGEVQRRTSAGFVAGLSIGTPGHVLKVNAGATDIEWAAGGAWDPAAAETLTNKTIDANFNTISNIDNGDIKAAAGIAGTKIAPDFGAQNVDAASFRVGSGGTWATVGGVRVSTSAQAVIAGRNTAGTGDIEYVAISASNALFLGTDSGFTSAKQVSSINMYSTGAGNVAMGTGGSTYIYITGGAGVIETWKPRIGSASGSSPHASDGEAAIAGDANVALTAAQYSRHAIDISGTTATRTFTFPHPAAQDSSYKKLIINRTANSHTISTGTGTTATVPAGVLKYVWFSPSGADAA